MKLKIVYGRKRYSYASESRTVGEVATTFAASRSIPGNAFTLTVHRYGKLPTWTATRQFLRDGDEVVLTPIDE